MERDDDGAYEVKFYIFKGNNTNYSMEALNFTLPIPKGLRSASTTTTAPTDTLDTTPNSASTPSPSSPSPSSATSSTSSAGVSLFASSVVVVGTYYFT